jgi:hypothetical protein
MRKHLASQRRLWPLLRRVSDAGHDRRSQVHGGRRPKAAKERTRGAMIGGGAAASIMGIWLTRKVCAKERDAPGREQCRDRQATAAGIDGWDGR